jgi:hypothetical protein
MCKDFPDDLNVFDKPDDPHDSLAFGTNQRVNFIYLLNQPRPIFPEGFSVFRRFSDEGDDIVRIRLLPFTPGDVAVIDVISDHLLAAIVDMRTPRIKYGASMAASHSRAGKVF